MGPREAMWQNGPIGYPCVSSGETSMPNDETGKPLPLHLRVKFEKDLGANSLANVRIHESMPAGIAVNAMGAQAFTQGEHIYLRSGVSPHRPAGQHILAHELTHVLQQGAVTTSADPSLRPTR